MSTAKRHHHNTQHYLRRFTDPATKKVTVYRREWSTPKALSTKDTGVEKLLYAAKDVPELKTDELETLFNHEIDGPSRPVFDALIAGTPLSREDRLLFARYVAFQQLRTPWAREQVAVQSGFTAREVAERNAASLGIRVEPPTIDPFTGRERPGPLRFREHGREDDDEWYEVVSPPEWWLGVLTQSVADREVPNLIAGLPWHVAEAPPDESFITCDTQVLQVRVRPESGARPRGGWTGPGMETTLALDPRHVLIIRHDVPEGRSVARAEWCADLRARTLHLAAYELYAAAPVPGLEARFPRTHRPSLQWEKFANQSGSQELWHYFVPDVHGMAYQP